MTVKETVELDSAAASYLKQPYARLVVPETDGTFRAEVLEFPGCIATGDTASQALAALKEAAKDWLIAALERGQNIPDPVEYSEFSGRLALRLPKSLHRKAAMIAEREGVSLNQFILAGLAEYVGERARSYPAVTIATASNVGSSAFVEYSTTELTKVIPSVGPATMREYRSPAGGPIVLTDLSRRIG